MVTVALCGDVMLGRGIDRILPHPGDPTLREAHVDDAVTYVELAERVNGPIRWPVPFSWPWGEALRVLDAVPPDVRVVNLETSVTRSGQFAPGKQVHYRMDPDNLPCLTAARPDVTVLANNHVLDFGRRGLEQTLDVLTAAGMRTAGAGRDRAEAQRVAEVPLALGGRLSVLALGTPSSGIPAAWAAEDRRPGVALGSDLWDAGASEVVDRVRRCKREGDLVVVSIHWGSNWGYRIPRGRVRFAHALVDGGADIVHGHSSHHPRPIEVYRDRVILYGCGDFIDDYEGITGHEAYRGDLRLLYLVSVARDDGRLVEVRMVPMQARRMRLEHASSADVAWLRDTLDRTSRPFGSRVSAEASGELTLRTG